MADRIVVVNELVMTPDGRPYWITPEILRAFPHIPKFNISVVAKAFFGINSETLRYWVWKEIKSGGPILDGSRMEISRKGKYRVYSIADIERLAHALAQAGYIDGERLVRIVLMVKTSAQMYGVPL